MAATSLQWTGSPESVSRAIFEAGYPLQLDPALVYELPADVADSLLASTDGWVIVDGGRPETAKEIVARIADATDAELERFTGDKRVSVSAAARAESQRRQEAAPAPADEPAAEEQA